MKRWQIIGPLTVAVAAAIACGGCGSSAAPSAGSTGSTHSAVAKAPKPNTPASTQPATQTATIGQLQGISKLCLVTMPQLETLSPTIFKVAALPIDQPSTSGVDSCQYGGKTTASGLVTKFLSITVLGTWSGMPNHFAAQSGFANASAGVVSAGGTTLVIAGAQITSGTQNGSWLTLTVGNNGPPLVTWQALKATLSEAESQYSASANNSPSSSSTGGTSGNTTSSKNVACNLLSGSEVNQFEPPDTHGLNAVNTGGGSHVFEAGTTDFICGYAWWTGGSVNQGTEDGDLTVDLACGPSASDSMLSDQVNSQTFTVDGKTAAIGLIRGLGSVGTGGDLSQLWTSAIAKAQAIHACG